jgi:hypothetical protein
MNGIADRMYVAILVALALAMGMMAYGAWGPTSTADAQPNPDPGCVVGNNPTGACLGGNQGQAGGGVGCQGGSNEPRDEPCGREGDDGTLNENGNVPGCTSQGNAVNQNPHCDQYGSPY